jgi:mRNA-degrading endonuclease RelE of RelBE toxin-antitoxin system
VALEKISISGISDVYAVSAIKKEFKKAVNQPWKNSDPYPEYQKKLLADLAVLDDIEKEKAIDLAAFEKLTNEKDLYSIHRPNSRKNVRIIYTIIDRKIIILLTVFLEKNKSDYQNAISVAKNRLKQLQE